VSYRTTRRVVLLTALSASLPLLGCGVGPTASGDPATAAPSAPGAGSASAPTAGSASPSRTTVAARTPSTPAPTKIPDSLRFTGTTVDGKPFDGASLVGKPALLWFWAPWCPTCRSQIGQVRNIAAAHQGTVNVVGVGSLDGGEAIKRFARDVPGVTHLTDEQGAIWRHFAVTEQSSFVLLDGAGTTVMSVGYGGSADIAATVDDLVAR